MTSWQSAVGIHPFRWSHWLPIWWEGMCENVGPVVKWDSHYCWYYIHYVDNYACGFSSFFFVLYFKIFNSLFSICQLFASFFSLPIHPWRPWKTGVFSVSKPVGLPTKCSIELLVTFALYERANVLNSVASEMVVHFRGCTIARTFPSFTGHDHCSWIAIGSFGHGYSTL